MKKKLTWLLIIVIIAGGAAYAYFKLKSGTTDTVKMLTAKAERGEFLIKISETGMLEAKESRSIMTPISGKIIKLVPEGELVKEGDLLFAFEDTELQRKIVELESNLKITKSDLDKVKENLALERFNLEIAVKTSKSSMELDKVKLQDARDQYEDEKKLVEAGVLSQSTLDSTKLKVLAAELSLERSQFEHEKAKQALNSKISMEQMEIDKAQVRVDKAQSDLEEAQEELREAQVKAPGTGIVVYKMIWKGSGMEKVREGDEIGRRRAIMDLPDLTTMLVKTLVNERDYNRINKGLEVRITLDAYPDKPLTGKVTQISTLAKDKSEVGSGGWWNRNGETGVKVFELTVEIDGVHDFLKPGMTTRNDIVIDIIPDAVYVPIESVFQKDGETVVYVVEDGRPIQRKVEVGSNNEDYIIIKDGISEGELVTLLDPTKSLSDLNATLEPISEEKPAREEETETVGSAEATVSGG